MGPQSVGEENSDTVNQPVSTALILATLFLFVFWPSLNFIAENTPLSIDPGPVLVVAGVFYGLSVLVLFVAWKLTGDRERIAALVCAGTFALFMVQPVRAAIDWAGVSFSVMGAWFVVLVVSLGLTWLVMFRRRNFLLLTTFGAIGFLTAAVGIAAQTISSSQTSNPEKPARQLSSGDDQVLSRKPGKFPTVVYIVVDTYARSDELLRQTNYDNRKFIRDLGKLGFRTLEKSTSNYFFSNLSIANTLSMRYLMGVGKNEVESYADIEPILTGDNDVARRFKDLGYRMVTSGTRLCSAYEHTCIAKNTIISHEMWAFLHTTPIPLLISYASSGLYGNFSTGGQYRMEDLIEKIAGFSFSKLFLLVHELGVHDNLYEADCSLQKKLAENDLKRQNRPDRQLNEKKPFIQTVKCINKLVVRFVEMILRKDKDAIIVLAADHGTGFSRKSGERSKAVIRERSAVLSSWRLPPHCRSLPYDSMSNVNHFRAIFACLTGEKPDYLEDKVFSGLSYGDVRPANITD